MIPIFLALEFFFRLINDVIQLTSCTNNKGLINLQILSMRWGWWLLNKSNILNHNYLFQVKSILNDIWDYYPRPNEYKKIIERYFLVKIKELLWELLCMMSALPKMQILYFTVERRQFSFANLEYRKFRTLFSCCYSLSIIYKKKQNKSPHLFSYHVWFISYSQSSFWMCTIIDNLRITFPWCGVLKILKNQNNSISLA